MPGNSVPRSGFHTVTPRMVVDDVDAAVQFLRQCFEATGEVVPGRPVEVQVGDSVIMVSGTTERNAFPVMLYVYVEDVEATYERAIALGATAIELPRDVPSGDRRAVVTDRFGNVYQIAAPRL